ncbi:MAG TPA: hypothetical protein VN519_10650 [Bryobacteraceae bacterium]|nr:hypothetical protein [Bryobacteraceae bacterium]
MFRKITTFAVALSVLLLMQFANCYAMSLDRNSMQCCHHMPCNPANKAHDCCKHMVSAQTPSALPVIHAPFVTPVAILVDWVPPSDVERPAQFASPGSYPPQHSPPHLYIVHAALLI